MARINQWAFRGQILNSQYVRIRQMVGPFSLPPLRGSDWVTYGHTGELFVPKLHGPRDIQLELIVRDVPYGIAPIIFDQLSLLFANRAQGSLANILDSGTRTGQAECTSWVPADMSVGGTTFVGTATFHLADPWLYGPTVSGSVTPTNTISVDEPAVSGAPIQGPRTTWTQTLTGTTSGQPLLLVHANVTDATYLTSIADTYATPHTWTMVARDHASGLAFELWIGTGGVGTSGIVTVTSASKTIGGFVLPFVNASTAAGLSAIDVSGASAGGSVSLSPSASWGAALAAWLYPSPGPAFSFRNPSISGAPPRWIWEPLLYSGTGLGDWGEAIWGMPSLAGVAATAAISSPLAETVSAILKSSSVPASVVITNPGTATVEGMTITITGPINSPAIYNATTGAWFMLTGQRFTAGQSVVIDTARYTVTRSDGYNMIYAAAGNMARWMTLAPGTNTLYVFGYGTSGASNVSISFAPPYE